MTRPRGTAALGGRSPGADATPMGRRVLSTHAEEYLSWLGVEKGRSANTLVAYRRDVASYEAWLAARGLTLSGIDEGTVSGYLAWLQDQGRAPATVARAVVAVRGLHRFCLDEGRLETDPTADIKTMPVPQGLPKALAEEEVQALLGSVVGDDARARRDRAILEVLYGSGLRISELVGLSLDDLALEEGILRVLGKGSKERLVPFGRLAARALSDWLGGGGRGALVPRGWARRDDAEALFLNAQGRRLSRQGAWLVVHSHGQRIGLGDRLTPHVLRHSCATHMLDHGADIRVVQELLGHASIATTQVYTKVSASRLRAAYTAAHPRARA